jgi:hypothetical protein
MANLRAKMGNGLAGGCTQLTVLILCESMLLRTDFVC